MIKGEDVSDKEKEFVKRQSGDLVRILPLVAISGLPIPIPITPLLIMLGKKYGFDLLPKDHRSILNDDVETRVNRFSGGYVFFANYRYNKDEEEYTPIIYSYIEAYNTNFENIYDYFQNIFKYFKKINKKMGNIYEKEYKNVAVEYKKHPEYKKQSANARIATQAINATIATNAAVSAVKKQLNNISNNVATKDFENRLNEMKHRIGVTKDEIDNLYHKI
jgi:hypothetical protein